MNENACQTQTKREQTTNQRRARAPARVRVGHARVCGAYIVGTIAVFRSIRPDSETVCVARHASARKTGRGPCWRELLRPGVLDSWSAQSIHENDFCARDLRRSRSVEAAVLRSRDAGLRWPCRVAVSFTRSRGYGRSARRRPPTQVRSTLALHATSPRSLLTREGPTTRTRASARARRTRTRLWRVYVAKKHTCKLNRALVHNTHRQRAPASPQPTPPASATPPVTPRAMWRRRCARRRPKLGRALPKFTTTATRLRAPRNRCVCSSRARIAVNTSCARAAPLNTGFAPVQPLLPHCAAAPPHACGCRGSRPQPAPPRRLWSRWLIRSVGRSCSVASHAVQPLPPHAPLRACAASPLLQTTAGASAPAVVQMGNHEHWTQLQRCCARSAASVGGVARSRRRCLHATPQRPAAHTAHGRVRRMRGAQRFFFS